MMQVEDSTNFFLIFYDNFLYQLQCFKGISIAEKNCISTSEEVPQFFMCVWGRQSAADTLLALFSSAMNECQCILFLKHE